MTFLRFMFALPAAIRAAREEAHDAAILAREGGLA